LFGNPWGFDFRPGTRITKPPAALCDYFPCIASFWGNTKGYVIECKDGMFSHAGGRPGACSSHGGVNRTLYGH
jgi:hypothetical protein